LVDAREKTHVTQKASAYDHRSKEEEGCDPDGCKADFTRDQDQSDDSRWSCQEDLMDDNCEIKYEFDEPQDIVRLDVQFYKGDERSRTLKITSNDGFRQIVESSGHSQGFEEFDVDTRGSSWLTLEGLGMDGDEWLSITEVGY
ncbi:unnamed protein product, partial [Pylaiella littoralis]